MFPTITSIEEFRSHTSHKEEIREADIGHGSKSFCYMISAEGTFETDWLRECRGIVFNEAGQVTGRPLHKFFNVGERPSTHVENIDWTKVERVMVKNDGCLDGETIILTANGPKTIREIVDTKYQGLVLGEENGQIVKTQILGHSKETGSDKQWYEIKTLCGTVVRLTGNHMVFSKTRNDYIRTDELTLSDEIVLIDEI